MQSLIWNLLTTICRLLQKNFRQSATRKKNWQLSSCITFLHHSGLKMMPLVTSVFAPFLRPMVIFSHLSAKTLVFIVSFFFQDHFTLLWKQLMYLDSKEITGLLVFFVVCMHIPISLVYMCSSCGLYMAACQCIICFFKSLGLS